VASATEPTGQAPQTWPTGHGGHKTVVPVGSSGAGLSRQMGHQSAGSGGAGASPPASVCTSVDVVVVDQYGVDGLGPTGCSGVIISRIGGPLFGPGARW
jgi:hypothetical protein